MLVLFSLLIAGYFQDKKVSEMIINVQTTFISLISFV